MRFLILLLFFSQFSFAQDYSPIWGEKQKIPGGSYNPVSNLGILNGNYYLSFVSGSRNTILRYDLNHKFIGRQELEIVKGKRNLSLKEIIETKNGYFSYSGLYNSKERTYSLFAYELVDGKFRNRRKIFTQDLRLSGMRSATGGRLGLIFNRAASQLGIPGSDFVMSADSNLVAFHNLVSDRNFLSEDQIMVGLFDASLNLKWKKKQNLKYQDRDLSIVQSAVSVKGEIFILAKLFERKRTKDRRLPRYDYKIFRITEDSFEEFDVKLKGINAPSDAGLFIPPDEDQVIVGGFYTNAERRGGLLGSFLFRIDLSSNDLSNKIYKFSPKVLADIVPKGRIRRNRGLDEDRYDIKDIISFSDGSMAIVAEANWVVTHRSPNTGVGGGFSEQKTFYSDAIIMPTFTADGELEEVAVIDKQFSSGSTFNQSYGIGWDNGRIILVYNDFKTSREKREFEGKKGSIHTDMTLFSNYGEQLFQGNLFNNRDLKSVFTPRMTSFREGKMMLVAMRSGKFQIGIIDLE